MGRQRTVTGAYSDQSADSGKDRIRNTDLQEKTIRSIADWVEENSGLSAPITKRKA